LQMLDAVERLRPIGVTALQLVGELEQRFHGVPGAGLEPA
jgi:hypothetical protein